MQCITFLTLHFYSVQLHYQQQSIHLVWFVFFSFCLFFSALLGLFVFQLHCETVSSTILTFALHSPGLFPRGLSSVSADFTMSSLYDFSLGFWCQLFSSSLLFLCCQLSSIFYSLKLFFSIILIFPAVADEQCKLCCTALSVSDKFVRQGIISIRYTQKLDGVFFLPLWVFLYNLWTSNTTTNCTYFVLDPWNDQSSW